MSLNLKNFIIREEIRSSHAVKFLDYQENFHDDVQEDLVALLSKEWKKLVDKLSTVKPHGERAENMALKNPEAFLGLEFTNAEANVGSGRFSKPKVTSVSVKISHAYSADQRRVLVKQFLDSAKESFEKIINKNEEAFAIKMASGNVKILFHAKKSDDETVKLQFKTIDKQKDSATKDEVVKTIFMVGVEHGKEGSKSKHYDRIFFIDYTK